MNALAQELPRAAINAKLVSLIATGSIALGVFLSGFVIREPAPYELYMVVLLPVWALFGLKFSRGIMPLVTLIVLFNIGGFLSMTVMAEIRDTPLYLAVSLFLGFTAIFFAAVTEQKPYLLKPMFDAWIVAAVFTSFFGILGYFHAFPGAEMFTKYERAAGVFQDPNVFGPFLVPPALVLLHRLVTGRVSAMPLRALPLLIITLGAFLSFSRGAWGLFAFAMATLVLLLFIQNRSGLFRLRIIIMSALAVALLFIAILVVLQIPSVAELFSARAQLVQSYDAARLGRFARHAIGFLLALEKPLGIGPLNFGLTYGEDTHDIWLKALMDYGWLGFVSYVTLIVWTLAAGFRILFRPRPWQPYLMCAWIALLGHTLLGTVIDTDHWRHFYILLGMVWGIIALEMKVQQARAQGHEHPALTRSR